MSRVILVIDDSLTVRKILETCLCRAGYEVKSFPDGVEALRWLAKSEACIPALVLVDLGLPKLDGYDVIRHLKTRSGFEQTVLVILSRRDSVLDRIKGRLAGAHAYVTKPFRTQTIIALVQAYLGVAAGGEAAAQSSTGLLHAHEQEAGAIDFQREEQYRDRAAGAIPRARRPGVSAPPHPGDRRNPSSSSHPGV